MKSIVIKPKRVLALISDMHLLSDLALCPPGIVNEETQKHISAARSPGQLKIYEHWLNFCRVCDQWGVDTIINHGDTIQGCNPKESGIRTMDADIEVQKYAAVKILAPLVKNRIYHSVSGTKYHESIDSKIHKDITERLKPYCKKAVFHGAIANIKLIGTNRILNAAHATTGAAIYRTTIMDRESLFLSVAEAEGRLPHIDYISRGHLHTYFTIDLGRRHIIQVPGWQAWYPFKDRVRNYGRMQPDIGGVIMFIDEENRTTLHHYLYPAPHIIDFVKEG